ncbi:MAG: HAD family hydrolase [Lachnospiraceae bacterium]|nr:HAD family hydrolase [Lachnospiraceae bacterium]
MNKELFIFDMDGTILNTIEDITNAVNYILKKNNFPARTVDEVKFFVGNGLMKTLQRSVPEGTGQTIVDELFPEFIEYYKSNSNICTKPYDYIADVIRKLKKAGKHTAVVSNKRDEAVKELCEVFFLNCFEMALGDMEGVPRKPEPNMVYNVIEHFGIPKEKVVYIGDSDVDIKTAENAGVDCIAVSWGFRDKAFLQEHGASTIIDNPKQLLELL